jgi:hypothetical protein
MIHRRESPPTGTKCLAHSPAVRLKIQEIPMPTVRVADPDRVALQDR